MSKSVYSLRDADIRPALRSYLAHKHGHDTGTVVLEELGISCGRVRVDIAVVNGSLHGYEIKSDRDTLKRLDNQVQYYSRVLDKATLVVGKRHLSAAERIIPSWWEIILIESAPEEVQFKLERPGKGNPGREPRSIVELLWLDDALALLEQRNVARGVRGKPRQQVWDRICEHFHVEEISAAVRENLKARSNCLSIPKPL